MVKEIFAGTLTVADIASTGSATLATTDANTQYVIKDVSVSGVFNTGDKPGLMVNDFRVAELATPATGSEIVDVDSTLKYQAYASAPVLTSTALKLIAGTSGSLALQSLTQFKLNGVVAGTTGAAPTSITTDLTSPAQATEFAQANDGSLFYVYWDGNSDTRLYKRTGGANGSESQIFSLSYGWIVFDGIDTYYQGRYTNSTLHKYNINTGSSTTVGTGVTLADTSYPSASLMNNGMLLVNPSGNSQTDNLLILNPQTGASTRINGLQSSSVSGNQYKISGYYDAATNRYTLYKRWGSALYKARLKGAVTIGSTYSSGVTNSTFEVGSIGPSSGNYNTAYVAVDADNYSIAVHNIADKTDLATFSTVTLTTKIGAWLTFETRSNTIMQNVTSPASASSFQNSVKVRVTGVKSTI